MLNILQNFCFILQISQLNYHKIFTCLYKVNENTKIVEINSCELSIFSKNHENICTRNIQRMQYYLQGWYRKAFSIGLAFQAFIRRGFHFTEWFHKHPCKQLHHGYNCYSLSQEVVEMANCTGQHIYNVQVIVQRNVILIIFKVYFDWVKCRKIHVKTWGTQKVRKLFCSPWSFEFPQCSALTHAIFPVRSYMLTKSSVRYLAVRR